MTENGRKAALADPPRLDSREYKLMLKPKSFGGRDPLPAIKGLAEDELRQLICDHVSDKASADFLRGSFELSKRRLVRFWDTAGCILEEHGFAFRERADLDPQDNVSAKRELTLKFRAKDLFLVAATPLPAGAGSRKWETKLEEDVMPLAVRARDGSAIVANPASTHSHFSRSTKQPIASEELPARLEDLADFYPTLFDNLKASGAEVDPSAKLEPSEGFTEQLFESPQFKLGDDIETKFALLLWYPRPATGDTPALAEISFKYATVGEGGVTRKVAQRALRLLCAMQRLKDAKPDALTKTALASPAPCAD